MFAHCLNFDTLIKMPSWTLCLVRLGLIVKHIKAIIRAVDLNYNYAFVGGVTNFVKRLVNFALFHRVWYSISLSFRFRF